MGLQSDGTLIYTGEREYIDLNDRRDVDNWKNIVAFDVSDTWTVAVKSNGKVFLAGQGTDDYQKKIKKWKNIKSVSTENGVIVGLKKDGSVVAIGNNDYGQCNVN